MLEKLPEYNQYSSALYAPFYGRLRAVYAAMDRKYNEAADYYGFDCKECKENCCFTRFHHYTFLEYLYILKGYNALEPEKQIEVKSRALEVCAKTVESGGKGMAVRLICPLSFDGLCLLYAYRPMICRLHGISHQLKMPDQNVVYGRGCEAFTKQCGKKDYFKFDRTPFYIKMSELEKELKETAGITQRFKMTIAQMLTSNPDPCQGLK